jgi:enamine deaminase RidA (YjgF/YER057c/UK114 family)
LAFALKTSEKTMLGIADKKLESLGYPLDRVPAIGAIYRPVVIDGTTVYTSGSTPFDGDQHFMPGKVPSVVSVETAQKAAALCVANILRNVRNVIGTLDHIERVMKTVGYVNSDLDFTDQHIVINGGSELLRAVFGDHGIGVRTAIGMAQLPLGACAELDIIFKLKKPL